MFGKTNVSDTCEDTMAYFVKGDQSPEDLIPFQDYFSTGKFYIVPDMMEKYVSPAEFSSDLEKHYVESTLTGLCLLAYQAGLQYQGFSTDQVTFDTNKSICMRILPKSLWPHRCSFIQFYKSYPIVQEYFRLENVGYFCTKQCKANTEFSCTVHGYMLLDEFSRFMESKKSKCFVYTRTPKKYHQITGTKGLVYEGVTYTKEEIGTTSYDIFVAKLYRGNHPEVSFQEAIERTKGTWKPFDTVTRKKGELDSHVDTISFVNGKLFSQVHNQYLDTSRTTCIPYSFDIVLKPHVIDTKTKAKINVENLDILLKTSNLSKGTIRKLHYIKTHLDEEDYFTCSYYTGPTYPRLLECGMFLQGLNSRIRKELLSEYVEVDISGASSILLFEVSCSLFGYLYAKEHFKNLYQCARSIQDFRNMVYSYIKDIDPLVDKEYVKQCINATIFGANITTMTKDQGREFTDLETYALQNPMKTPKSKRLSFYTGTGYRNPHVPAMMYECSLLGDLSKELHTLVLEIEKKYKIKHNGRTSLKSPFSDKVLDYSYEQNGKRRRIKFGAKLAFVYQSAERVHLDAIRKRIGDENIALLIHDGIYVHRDTIKELNLNRVAREVSTDIGLITPYLSYVKKY